MLIAQQSRLVGHSSFSNNLDYRRKTKLTYCIIITDKVTGNSKIGILPEYSLLPGRNLEQVQACRETLLWMGASDN